MRGTIRRGLCVMAAAARWGAPRAEAAVDPATIQAVSAAMPAVTPGLKLVKDVAAVPLTALDAVRLPLGLVEVVMSPLPGLTLRSGFHNMGVGLAAPVKLVGATLNVPASVVNTVLQIGGSCAPQAPAVLSAAPGVEPAGRHVA